MARVLDATFINVIDQTIEVWSRLKSEIAYVNANFWYNDWNDILLYLNGMKSLLVTEFQGSNQGCFEAKARVEFLKLKLRELLKEWNDEEHSPEWLNAFYNRVYAAFSHFTSKFPLFMEACRQGTYFEEMKIGCNDFLTVYANIDVLQGSIPDAIQVEGQNIRVKTLRADGFEALYNKSLPSFLENGGNIVDYSIPLLKVSAFFLVVCQETPFILKAFKLIEKAPVPGETWDVSGGLQNFNMDRGLGTRLMRATEALGNEYRIEKIKILVVDSAREFYRKFGMTDDNTRLYMIKRIGVLRGRKYFTLDDIKKGAEDALRLR